MSTPEYAEPTSRLLARDAVARFRRIVDLDEELDTLVEILDLMFATVIAETRAESMTAILAAGGEELSPGPPEKGEGAVKQDPVSGTGEPLAGNLKVDEEGLTFSV